jgi:hypothetical protein
VILDLRTLQHSYQAEHREILMPIDGEKYGSFQLIVVDVSKNLDSTCRPGFHDSTSDLYYATHSSTVL